MKNNVKILMKILAIGILVTICRIIFQLFIPENPQTILQPTSLAVEFGIPILFTIYGIFAYSTITALFLFIGKNLTGSKIIQGLKFGAACATIWFVYLLEPLPHTILNDTIPYIIDTSAYILADCISLLILGLLVGIFFGQNIAKKENSIFQNKAIIPLVIMTALFVIGRLVQYTIIDIYSTFNIEPLSTIAWILMTGFVLSILMYWFNQYINNKPMDRAIILGFGLFGVNIILFNFVIPLIFVVDIPDLIIRTIIDIIAVTLGCLVLNLLKPKINKIFF